MTYPNISHSPEKIGLAAWKIIDNFVMRSGSKKNLTA